MRCSRSFGACAAALVSAASAQVCLAGSAFPGSVHGAGSTARGMSTIRGASSTLSAARPKPRECRPHSADAAAHLGAGAHRAGAHAETTSRIVAVDRPDIALCGFVADIDHDHRPGTAVNFSTGSVKDFVFAVVNLGSGAPETSLTITVPDWLVLIEAGRDVGDDLVPLKCDRVQTAATTQWKCPLGPMPPITDSLTNPGIEVFLKPGSAPPVGTHGRVRFAAAPDPGQGRDSDPSNNSASAAVRFVGGAALSATLAPAATELAIGQDMTITVTIHNAGPQPARHTRVVITTGRAGAKRLGSPCCPLLITGFTDTTKALGAPPPRPGPPARGRSVVVWLPAQISPHSAAHASMTVTARATGQATINLYVESTEPACPDLDCAHTQITVQVTPPPPSPTPTASTAPLAVTGPPARQNLDLAILLLIAGAALTVAGRRRGSRPYTRRPARHTNH